MHVVFATKPATDIKLSKWRRTITVNTYYSLVLLVISGFYMSPSRMRLSRPPTKSKSKRCWLCGCWPVLASRRQRWRWQVGVRCCYQQQARTRHHPSSSSSSSSSTCGPRRRHHGYRAKGATFGHSYRRCLGCCSLQHIDPHTVDESQCEARGRRHGRSPDWRRHSSSRDGNRSLRRYEL